jgi:hypothetical protein
VPHGLSHSEGTLYLNTIITNCPPGITHKRIATAAVKPKVRGTTNLTVRLFSGGWKVRQQSRRAAEDAAATAELDSSA